MHGHARARTFAVRGSLDGVGADRLDSIRVGLQVYAYMGSKQQQGHEMASAALLRVVLRAQTVVQPSYKQTRAANRGVEDESATQ